jgi:hypothetical protein
MQGVAIIRSRALKLTKLKDHTSTTLSITFNPLETTLFSILPNNKTIYLQKKKKKKKENKNFFIYFLTSKTLGVTVFSI